MNLQKRRVLVTGGAGFLGQHVVRTLRARGCEQVFVPRRKEYDLTREANVERLHRDARPEVVIHLAALVGGIGANRLNPGRFLFENLMMGAMLMEYGRLFEVEKFVCIGTICSYPNFTPVPFQEKDLWNGYPEETNAPYGLAKKMLLVQGQAYRQQYGVQRDSPPAGESLRPRRRKCLEAKRRRDPTIVCWGDGTPTREFFFVGDSAQAIVLATERYDGPDAGERGHRCRDRHQASRGAHRN